MRTLLAVVILVALALAAGGSFIVRAQDAAATLEHRCDPPTLPSGVDTLVRCSFTAHNTGSIVLSNARLSIVATSAPIPDAYYVFAATRDGSGQPVSEGTLTYEYGDLAPGASSTLALDVIVRTTHAYGAEAQLAAGDVGHQYATAALGADITAASGPGLTVNLTDQRDASGEPGPSFRLLVRNDTGAALRDVRVELAQGETSRLAPLTGWLPAGAAGHLQFAIGAMGPSEGVDQTLSFVANELSCSFVHPAVVVTADSEAGPVVAAAIADGSASLGPCNGQGGGGDAPPAQASSGATANARQLPASGSGPDRAGNTRTRATLLTVAVGLLLIAAGLSVRRAYRR